MMWIAIIIGLIATLVIIYYAIRMQGSIIGHVLLFFGAGMGLVVLGSISAAIVWGNGNMQKIVHDLLLIIGYLVMLLGVHYIRKLHR